MKLRSRLDNIVSRKWDFFKSRFIVFEKNILYYLGIAVPRLYLLISHASSLSWPPKDDNFFSHVGLRGGSQSCSKQVYGNQFITKRLRDIGHGTAGLQDSSGARDPLQEKSAKDRRVEARPERSRRTRGLGRNLPGDAPDLLTHQAGGPHVSARINLWGKWYRQGVGCAGDP